MDSTIPDGPIQLPAGGIKIKLPARGQERERVTGTVWHYTDLRGLLGMLRNNELWASSATHLNDEVELQHGIDQVQRAFDGAPLDPHERAFVQGQLHQAKTRLLLAETFVLSASTDGDSLSQWRAYGRGAGYAVGFDAEARFDLLPNPKSVPPEEGIEGDYGQYVSPWQRVLYEPPEQFASATDLVEQLAELAPPAGEPPIPVTLGVQWNEVLAATLHGPSGYAGTVTLMKHAGFRDEQEVRVFATASDSPRFHDLREGAFGPTPFVRLTGAHRRKQVHHVTYAATEARPLPICEVRIGPTPHRSPAESGVRAALARFGYSTVGVSHSEVPFR